MRFMMFICLDPNNPSEKGTLPDAESVKEMMKYNEELAKAGVLLSLDGLHPTSKGARITFPGGKPKVTDGPFAEAKEVIGGYWMIQVRSREEAIQWASRVPEKTAKHIELRQVFDMSDFPADVQKAADSPLVRAAVDKTGA